MRFIDSSRGGARRSGHQSQCGRKPLASANAADGTGASVDENRWLAPMRLMGPGPCGRKPLASANAADGTGASVGENRWLAPMRLMGPG
jgi:hypothetical protein